MAASSWGQRSTKPFIFVHYVKNSFSPDTSTGLIWVFERVPGPNLCSNEQKTNELWKQYGLFSPGPLQAKTSRGFCRNSLNRCIWRTKVFMYEVLVRLWISGCCSSWQCFAPTGLLRRLHLHLRRVPPSADGPESGGLSGQRVLGVHHGGKTGFYLLVVQILGPRAAHH